MTVDEAMKYAQGQLESAFEKWLSDECPSGDVEQVQRQWDESLAHEELVNELQPVMALTWEVRRLRSEIDSAREDLQSFVDARNEWKAKAEAAEAALKEAQEQKPVAWINLNKWTPSNGPRCVTHEEYEKERELLTKLTAVYAAPVPAVAAPAVLDANPVQWLADEGDMILVPRGLLGAACSSIDKQRPAPKVLEALRYYTMSAPQAPAVPGEWREVMAELAADLQSACDAEHPHRDQYPSVMRKYNNDMKIIEKARALLQSADHSERNLEKVAPDCRNCANRGRVNGLSQETYCESCVHEGRNWRKNHFLDAAGQRLLEGGE